MCRIIITLIPEELYPLLHYIYSSHCIIYCSTLKGKGTNENLNTQIFNVNYAQIGYLNIALMIRTWALIYRAHRLVKKADIDAANDHIRQTVRPARLRLAPDCYGA